MEKAVGANLVPATRASSRTVIARFNGRLGQRNPSDNYTLTVPRRGVFSVSLTGLQANAALQLRTVNGQVIARVNRPGRSTELIQRTLEPGRYSIRVSRVSGTTRYSLQISEASQTPGPVPVPTPIPPPAPNPAPNPTPAPADPNQSLWGNYTGIGISRIATIDALSGQVTAINEYQNTISVQIRPRGQGGGLVESNPYNLSFGSSNQNAPGGVLAFSAAVSSTPRGDLLVQYWNIQQNGTQMTGNLVNNNTGLALAANLINTPPTFINLLPFQPMANGTTLQGTVTPNEIRLQLQGFTTNGAYAFVVDIAAQRT